MGQACPLGCPSRGAGTPPRQASHPNEQREPKAPLGSRTTPGRDSAPRAPRPDFAAPFPLGALASTDAARGAGTGRSPPARVCSYRGTPAPRPRADLRLWLRRPSGLVPWGDGAQETPPSRLTAAPPRLLENEGCCPDHPCRRGPGTTGPSLLPFACREDCARPRGPRSPPAAGSSAQPRAVGP